MRLVWHIIWKDIRRLHWLLVLWGGVILLQFAAWRVAGGDLKVGGELGVVDFVVALWVLHLVIAWLLVPQLLQDDPVRDPRAAWRTRPISGGRLLAAKIGGMLLMLGLWPSVMTVLWWVEFGFGPGEIVRAVAVNTVGMIMFTGLALMVAVLTDSFARFIAWSLVVVVAVILGGLLLAVGMPVEGEGAVSAAILLTRASLAGGVVYAVVVAVVAVQFLTRRAVLARGIAIGGALVAAALVQGWPWSAAEMEARLGGRSLPTVTARMVDGTLVLPFDATRRRAWVRVTTEFVLKELAGGDLPVWGAVDPTWKIGTQRLGAVEPISVEWGWAMREMAALVSGKATAGARVERTTWAMDVPGKLGAQLRDGAAVLRVSNAGAIWRGELGPVTALRAGAGGASGWQQIHIRRVIHGRTQGDGGESRVSWWETGPLFQPTMILELLNPDGIAGRRRHKMAVLQQGNRALVDESPLGNSRTGGNSFLRGKIPVGLMSVAALSSDFGRGGWEAWGDTPEELLTGDSRLASVTLQEAAAMRVELAETPLVPDFVIEGSLDEALRRAKAEDKRVYALVRGEKNPFEGLPNWWAGWQLREVLTANFVCVQVGNDDAVRLRKKTDDPQLGLVAVLRANGEEQDRWRDLGVEGLKAALHANLAGKTYAAVLMERLAERDGEDRTLRLQLHEALRARGELAGAFEAILWMVDHPQQGMEGREIFDVTSRLQRFVAAYGPAKAALLERREHAIAALRENARDEGAARRLYVITKGVQPDDGIWREFPRLLPRENPAWWEFMRNWISSTVSQKEHREAAAAVDLENFFAEGPAWVRKQLLQKRGLVPGGAPATIADWQAHLVRTGQVCIEALARAGQPEAGLRLARAVLRVDGANVTRDRLTWTLMNRGAVAQAKQLQAENSYGR